MQRAEHHGFVEFSYVHGIMLESPGNIENRCLGDNVSFILFAQENLDFPVKRADEVWKFGA